MSTAGIGGLITLIAHGFFIFIGLTLLYHAIKNTDSTRIVLWVLFSLVTGTYISWVSTKDNWKNKLKQGYVGKYELTNYKGCKDCLLELKQDDSYRIYNSNKDYEKGTWKYFDDGDGFYVEFNNGRQLGSNEYEYLPK